MYSHRETNPHFVRPSHHVEDQQHHQPTSSPWLPVGPAHQEERPSQPLQGPKKSRRQKRHDQPVPVPPPRATVPHVDQHPHVPGLAPIPEPHYEPHGSATGPLRSHQRDQHHPVPGVAPVPPTSLPDQTDHPKQHGAAPVEPPHGDRDPRGWPYTWAPVSGPRHHDGERNHILLPPPLKTNFFAWSLAVFCAILWVLIILGGLAVLIVYLIFRPRSPRFDISAAALNAAYLDMGYLLNADATFLANFSNPNRKVSVDFSTMYVELYYGRTLIATQYVEPFSAPKASSGFRNIHMVTSQVRLPEIEIQRLKRQLANNGVIVELKGYLKARSKFGGLFRYSYWLHGRCTLLLTRPPDGVLIGKKCRTKH
ncbi:hypothetical protein UlMin_040170 [Ulmus minor]